MINLFGVQKIKFEGKHSISELDVDFQFQDKDIVLFFKSSVFNPSKLISPKGNIRDIIITTVRKSKDGTIQTLLSPIAADNLDIVRNLLLTNSKILPEKTVMVSEHNIEPDVELSKLVGSPTYILNDSDEKFVLRALDVIR